MGAWYASAGIAGAPVSRPGEHRKSQPVLDLDQLLANWGYLTIALVVLLGNVGLPVPEETVLALAGYLVWAGELRLPAVLLVGTVSAAAGDNLGYWLGRVPGRGGLRAPRVRRERDDRLLDCPLRVLMAFSR